MPGLASARESAAAAVGDTRAQRLYWDDVWTWSREQAAALRRRDLEAVDWENVIEEIEDVGNRHSDAWTSLCGNVIEHLLKMEHSHHERSLDHWRKEILAWRRKMFTVLKRHRGMKGKLDVMLDEAWEDGRGDAVDRLVDHAHPPNRAAEKALRRSWEERLPEECPYALEDIAGYDPEAGRYSRRDKEAQPDGDVWPASVARRMNEELGEDYPVRHRAPSRGAGRSR